MGGTRTGAILAALLLLVVLRLADAAAAASPSPAAEPVLFARNPAREAAAGLGPARPVAERAEPATAPLSGPDHSSRRPHQPADGAVQQAAWSAGLGTALAATIPVQPAMAAASGLPAPTPPGDAAISERDRRTVASPLEQRLQQWPAWRLPAPLARPGRGAPAWPAWFSGDWRVESTVLPADPAQPGRPDPPWCARFRPDDRGGAVADRAFNALSAGRSLLGETLLSVQDDPGNPQRQLARLADDQLLESTLIGQRGERPDPDSFLNDELSLQVLHSGGEPRVSRIETLGRWRRQADGSIAGEQWQGSYASPAAGLAAAALASEHWQLRLVPVQRGSGRATGTAAAAADCR